LLQLPPNKEQAKLFRAEAQELKDGEYEKPLSLARKICRGRVQSAEGEASDKES
jgi:hypothetical protein